MSTAAVLGAGPIGSAIAQRLAERSRVSDVLIIDDNGPVAEGKALDLRQSGPIGGFDTRLSAASDPLAAAGADVIVFAAPSQTPLLETAARELHAPHDRLIGTAASAVEPMIASLVNIELGQTGTNVNVTGRPPSFVVGWTAATIGGALVSERVPPHRLLAISRSIARLWPPGPQAIAAPTTLVIEALIFGSRRFLPAVTILDGELGVRGRAGLLPLELGRGRVLRRVTPSLSPQERTETITKLTARN